MSRSHTVSARGRTRFTLATVSAVALVLLFSSGANAVAVPVPLESAYSFAVLGATEVTNSGPTVINGDIGVSPGTNMGGGYTVNGAPHNNDAVAAAAQISLDAAITNAGGQGTADGTISADLGGQTLPPGIYDQGGPMVLNGVLTLNAGGDPNAVWLFRGGSNITVGVGSSVALAGGAQACNVYWVSVAETAIGGSANMIGTVMAGTSVTLGTDASLIGRALAATGNVTMLSNTITQVGCAVAGTGGIAAGDGSASASMETGPSDSANMFVAVVLGGVGVMAAILIRRHRFERS